MMSMSTKGFRWIYINDLSDLFIYALVLHSRYQLLPKCDWALIKIAFGWLGVDTEAKEWNDRREDVERSSKNSRDKTWYTLVGTNRSPPKALLKIIFVFQRWDMCSFPGRYFFQMSNWLTLFVFFVVVSDFPIQSFFGQKIATIAAIRRFLNHY